MPQRHPPRAGLKIMMSLFGLAGALGALWWALFALKPYDLSPEQLEALYAHASAATPAPTVQLGPVEPVTVGDTKAWAQSLGFHGFDGAWVVGRIVHPADPS